MNSGGACGARAGAAGAAKPPATADRWRSPPWRRRPAAAPAPPAPGQHRARHPHLAAGRQGGLLQGFVSAPHGKRLLDQGNRRFEQRRCRGAAAGGEGGRRSAGPPPRAPGRAPGHRGRASGDPARSRPWAAKTATEGTHSGGSACPWPGSGDPYPQVKPAFGQHPESRRHCRSHRCLTAADCAVIPERWFRLRHPPVWRTGFPPCRGCVPVDGLPSGACRRC